MITPECIKLLGFDPAEHDPELAGGESNSDPIMEDLKNLSAEELTKKYKISDANKLAKELGTKRPKEDGKNVKELEYWKHLKGLV